MNIIFIPKVGRTKFSRLVKQEDYIFFPLNYHQFIVLQTQRMPTKFHETCFLFSPKESLSMSVKVKNHSVRSFQRACDPIAEVGCSMRTGIKVECLILYLYQFVRRRFLQWFKPYERWPTTSSHSPTGFTFVHNLFTMHGTKSYRVPFIPRTPLSFRSKIKLGIYRK